jgi:hypothetical protein
MQIRANSLAIDAGLCMMPPASENEAQVAKIRIYRRASKGNGAQRQ